MHIPLGRLKFLALDCQTTGNSPQSHNILEIGWLDWEAMNPSTPHGPTPTTFFVRQPRQAPLSKRIQKLTGIGDSHIKHAVDARTALDALLKKASEVARENRTSRCPVVIHYARFEMGFLEKLYRRFQHPPPLPFNVICTHQIACRLMPQLPRKGIRAVAGYLGHSVPMNKRCAHHLLATVHIWRHLVGVLADQCDVHTLSDLQHWLKQSPVPAKGRIYPMSRDRRLGLPDSPGIYRMLRSNGDVLYIGKATSLKKRINSYFHKKRHPEAILEMLTQAVGLQTTRTGSALEAALRESDAIKEWNPPYNTALVGRHRRVHFMSRDFATQCTVMKQELPMGPVPSTEPFSAAHAWGLFMSTEDKSSLNIPRMMAMPDQSCPDEGTFLSGMALFQEKYRSVFRRMSTVPAVLHIGRVSWKEKLVRKATVDAFDTDSASIEEKTDFQWDPQAVVSSLEAICRRCGFLLRRARWFGILSESTIAWRAGSAPQGNLNIIVMHNGDLQQNGRTKDGSTIPDPPGSRRGHAKRRGQIDLMRYDRLRVLTTELRRLLAEERLICVRLGKKAYLYPTQLHQLFCWI